MDLIHTVFEGQNITTGIPMSKYMEKVQTDDAEAEFIKQDNLVGHHTVGNFIVVMATMTVHIVPKFAYQDQTRYFRRHVRKPKTIEVHTLLPG